MHHGSEGKKLRFLRFGFHNSGSCLCCRKGIASHIYKFVIFIKMSVERTHKIEIYGTSFDHVISERRASQSQICSVTGSGLDHCFPKA
jgi:hypothetical protein